MYAGLGLLFFFLVLFLQQVAGYSAIEAGTHDDPGDARHVPALEPLRRARGPSRAALLHGRRAAGGGRRAGALPSPRRGRDYLTELLPGLLVFALGLSMTVAPLTATVLADADEHNAGIASGVNNAIARVASLIAIAAVGAVVASVVRLGPSRRARARGPATRGGSGRSREAESQPLARVVVQGRAAAGAGARWPGAQRPRRSGRSTWRSRSPRHSWGWAACSG